MGDGIQPALLISACVGLVAILGFMTGRAKANRDEGATEARRDARIATLEQSVEAFKAEVLQKLAYRDLEHQLGEERDRRLASEAELTKIRGERNPR